LDKSEAISSLNLKNFKPPSEQQAEGLQKEQKRWREGKKRTAAHVSAAVRRTPYSVHYEYRCRSNRVGGFFKWMRTTTVESVLPEVLANDEPQPTAIALGMAEKTDNWRST